MSVRPLRARNDRACRRRCPERAWPPESAVLHRQRSAPAGGGLRRRRQAGRRVREPLEGCARGDVPRGGPRQPDDSLSRPVGPRQHRPCHQAQLDAAGRRRGRRGRRRHEGPPPAAGCSEGAAGPDGRTCGDEHERPRSRGPRDLPRERLVLSDRIPAGGPEPEWQVPPDHREDRAWRTGGPRAKRVHGARRRGARRCRSRGHSCVRARPRGVDGTHAGKRDPCRDERRHVCGAGRAPKLPSC